MPQVSLPSKLSSAKQMRGWGRRGSGSSGGGSRPASGSPRLSRREQLLAFEQVLGNTQMFSDFLQFLSDDIPKQQEFLFVSEINQLLLLSPTLTDEELLVQAEKVAHIYIWAPSAFRVQSIQPATCRQLEFLIGRGAAETPSASSSASAHDSAAAPPAAPQTNKLRPQPKSSPPRSGGGASRDTLQHVLTLYECARDQARDSLLAFALPQFLQERPESFRREPDFDDVRTDAACFRAFLLFLMEDSRYRLLLFWADLDRLEVRPRLHALQHALVRRLPNTANGTARAERTRDAHDSSWAGALQEASELCWELEELCQSYLSTYSPASAATAPPPLPPALHREVSAKQPQPPARDEMAEVTEVLAAGVKAAQPKDVQEKEAEYFSDGEEKGAKQDEEEEYKELAPEVAAQRKFWLRRLSQLSELVLPMARKTERLLKLNMWPQFCKSSHYRALMSPDPPATRVSPPRDSGALMMLSPNARTRAPASRIDLFSNALQEGRYHQPIYSSSSSRAHSYVEGAGEGRSNRSKLLTQLKREKVTRERELVLLRCRREEEVAADLQLDMLLGRPLQPGQTVLDYVGVFRAVALPQHSQPAAAGPSSGPWRSPARRSEPQLDRAGGEQGGSGSTRATLSTVARWPEQDRSAELPFAQHAALFCFPENEDAQGICTCHLQDPPAHPSPPRAAAAADTSTGSIAPTEVAADGAGSTPLEASKLSSTPSPVHTRILNQRAASGAHADHASGPDARDGKRQPARELWRYCAGGRLFNFALTDKTGQRLYAACLLLHPLPYTPEQQQQGAAQHAQHAICLMTRRPLFDLLRHALLSLAPHLPLLQNPSSADPLQELLSSTAFRTLLRLTEPLQAPLDLFGTARAPLQVPVTDLSLSPLLERLPFATLLQALEVLVLERKLLLVAEDYSLLCLAAEALRSLLYPFRWLYLLVPVLPYGMLRYLQCPTPFLVGLHSCYLPTALQMLAPEVVVLDLDSCLFACAGQLQSPSRPSASARVSSTAGHSSSAGPAAYGRPRAKSLADGRSPDDVHGPQGAPEGAAGAAPSALELAEALQVPLALPTWERSQVLRAVRTGLARAACGSAVHANHEAPVAAVDYPLRQPARFPSEDSLQLRDGLPLADASGSRASRQSRPALSKDVLIRRELLCMWSSLLRGYRDCCVFLPDQTEPVLLFDSPTFLQRATDRDGLPDLPHLRSRPAFLRLLLRSSCLSFFLHQRSAPLFPRGLAPICCDAFDRYEAHAAGTRLRLNIPPIQVPGLGDNAEHMEKDAQRTGYAQEGFSKSAHRTAHARTGQPAQAGRPAWGWAGSTPRASHDTQQEHTVFWLEDPAVVGAGINGKQNRTDGTEHCLHLPGWNVHSNLTFEELVSELNKAQELVKEVNTQEMMADVNT
eukprot:g66867.t1